MIFVTVGSFFFDELIEQVDLAVGGGQITEEIIMQIGYGGSYEPVHCHYFRSAPGLDDYYKQANLVIGHGGTGTTFEVLERGLRLISVSNPNLSDNHQREFLESLEQRGLIKYCRNLVALPTLIQDSLLTPPPPALNLSLFFQTVVDDLENWQPESITCLPTIRSWLGYMLAKFPPIKFLLQDSVRTKLS